MPQTEAHTIVRLGNLVNNGAMTTSYVAIRGVHIQHLGAIIDVA
jgi:hypothetical protein